MKSSGRTSFAIAAKSSGFLMSCFGKAMPPFGHSRIALSRASSSVGAQLTWSWRSFGTAGLPASRAALVAGHPEELDLLVGRADGDHPLGELAGLLGVDRAGGRDVDRDGLVRARVQLRALELEVLARGA